LSLWKAGRPSGRPAFVDPASRASDTGGVRARLVQAASHLLDRPGACRETGATCEIVLIKGGKLQKAVCKGTAIQPYDLSADQVSVDVLVRTGTGPRRWCTTFNALSGCTVVKTGADQKKYLAKNCTAQPAICPASPSGAFLDPIL
jgi:hypothetical protein